MTEITERDEILVAHALVDELLRERGTYVLALEQIRSAPLARETSIQRYKRCVEIANAALNKHHSARHR